MRSDELEELSSFYEAEKLQTLVLEEALQAEKENFNRLSLSLSEERKRAEEAAVRDSETILELRTALEIEKEKEGRLGVESSHPLARSNRGSKTEVDSQSTNTRNYCRSDKHFVLSSKYFQQYLMK